MSHTSPPVLRLGARGRRKAASAFPDGESVRTIVYVDGFNLYYGALRHTPFRWLNLDVLCRLLLPRNEVLRINYYTALVGAPPDNPDQPRRQRIYLLSLATLPSVRMYFGHYLSHPVRMPLHVPHPDGERFAIVVKTEEKGSDVNLATHLVSDAYEDAFDVAVLITNDSDLRTPVELVRTRLGKTIGILNPQRHPAAVLVRVASFFKTIRPGVLSANQFPSELADGTGRFFKPKQW